MFRSIWGMILCAISLATIASPDEIISLATPALKKVKAKEVFMMHMPAGSSIEEGSAQLVRIVEQGDLDNVTMVIGSEDPELMTNIMRKAFESISEDFLVGTNVVYVGEKESKKEIRRLVKKSGAKFVFVEYQRA